MDPELIQDTADRTVAGTISFPEVVERLLRAGVERYHVDYVGRRTTYYGVEGAATVLVPLELTALPAVAVDFDAAAVVAAIRDSQQGRHTYPDFSRKVMAAGVQGYHAFLRGRRVTYLGRQGDQHTEWFPGAEPAARTGGTGR